MRNEILSRRLGKITRLASPSTRARLLKLAVLVLGASAACLPTTAQSYKVTNLISDGSVPAAVTDANFINPWAISSSPTWWISTQGSGFNYAISATAGTISFKVIVPAASGLSTDTGLPAGSVTAAGATGMILPNGTKASFLFSTLDGTISGWNSKLGTANALSQIVVNNSAAGASYPGLAILTVGGNSYILAANFGTGNKIEVYDNAFASTKLAGTFTDPNLPTGYAPFSVHVIGTQVFVAYAVRTTAAPFRSVDARGNGIVSIFDTAGNFVARAVTGGNLNSPWGVAIAPANFGIFSNDLLIGNFGDGLINVYDPKSFAYAGQLMDGTGKALSYASLWELLPGGTAVAGTASVSGGDTSTVYFTAGLAGEAHGLLGGIANNTTAGGTPAFGFSASTGAATVTAGSSTQATISVAPVNGFSGSVTLACSGLPMGATCSFSPAQLTVTPTSSATDVVTIQTSKASASLQPYGLRGGYGAPIAAVFLLPFGSLLILRRRRLSGLTVRPFRILGVMVFFLTATAFLAGCSSSSSSSNPVAGTPAGQSNVVITATAGAVTQQTTLALTVQ